MNLLLIRSSEIESPNSIKIVGARRNHLVDVLKVASQDTIRIGFLNGPQGLGVVESVGDDAVRISHQLNSDNPPTSQASVVHVILAMPRPKVFGRILSHLAAQGVASITVIRSWHVEKSYLQTDMRSPQKSLAFLLEGLEQAKDTRLPKLVFFPLFRPFVEDELDNVVPQGVRLMAHPSANKSLAELTLDPVGQLVVAIGPERGWTDFECELLAAKGFQMVSLGERLLRVETALTVVVAQAQLLFQQAQRRAAGR